VAVGEERIVAHHVGARGFGVAFNCPPRFAKDLVHIVYEADSACAREMFAQNKDPNFHILPYCLGARDEIGTLFITKNPYASSNLEPNTRYYDHYCEVVLHGELDGVPVENTRYDVIYGNDFSVAETREVEIRAFESLLQKGKIPDGLPPDVLSLDTQGSELAILRGAERSFSDHCLALATEIEFHPMYQNQPLFSDIFDFALAHGFHFAGFTYLQEISSQRRPVGARAKGFLAFGDAVFLRSIDSVTELGRPATEAHLMLMKLAFIALNFGYLEYALQAFDAAQRYDTAGELTVRLARRDCYRLLGDLRAAVDKLPQQYLHTDRDKFVAERRQLLSGSEDQRIADRMSRQQKMIMDLHRRATAAEMRLAVELNRVRVLAVTRPWAALGKILHYLLWRLFNVPYTDPGALAAQRAAEENPLPVLEPPIAIGRHPTTQPAAGACERVLESYDYHWLAHEVRERRKLAEPFIMGQMH
jgi:FkbM family methyltransferase